MGSTDNDFLRYEKFAQYLHHNDEIKLSFANILQVVSWYVVQYMCDAFL
jgi:hypothetical protein